MKIETITIEGMTCGHCILAVRKALANLPYTTVEDVQVGSARVRYDESKVSRQEFANAIEEAGYRVLS